MTRQKPAAIVRSMEEIDELLKRFDENGRSFSDEKQTLRWLFGDYSPADPGDHADDETANDFVREHQAIADRNLEAARRLSES